MSIKCSILTGFLLGSACFLLANCLDYTTEENSDILVLNTENIQEALAQHEYLLVLYYKSTCPHSIDFLNRLPALAKHLKKIHSSIQIAKFEDHTQYLYKVNQRDPTKYPDLILHYGNHWTEYKYEREEQRDYEQVCLWLEDLVGGDVLFGRNQKESNRQNGNSWNVPTNLIMGLAVLLSFHALH